MLSEKNYPLILLGLSVLLFFFGLGWRDFWAPVEPRYAEIARIMFATDEWIVPRVNGEIYTDKPILYFWLVMLAAKAFGGVNEWAVRLPAALGGVGAVGITYLFGKDFFGARAGFLSAVVLATSMRVVWEARWAHIDMLFVCFFMMSIYCASRTLFDRGGAKHMLLAYVFMALATLAKGLIGVVLPALLFVSFMLVRRDWQLIVKARLALGVAIFLIVTMPWIILVNQATNGQWLNDFLFIHHFQRYTSGTGHRQPLFYYLTTLPVDLLPWTVFVLPALLAYRPYRRIWHVPVLLFCVLWFCAVFLFFSASDTKRDLYLLPLLPVAALLIGNYFDDLSSGKFSHTALFNWLAASNSALIFIIGAATPVAAWLIRRDAFSAMLPGAMTMAIGAAISAHYFRRRETFQAFASLAVMMTLLVLSATLWVYPYLENFKSRRPLAAAIRAVVPEAAPLYIYDDAMHDFNFYLRRDVVAVLSSAAEVDHLRRGRSASYVLIKNRDLKRLKTIPAQAVLLTRSTGSTIWNLVELRAAPSG